MTKADAQSGHDPATEPLGADPADPAGGRLVDIDQRPASASQPAPPGGVMRTLLSLPVPLFHAGLGFIFDHRFLLLVHTGRKSGKRRETPLEVVRYDRRTGEAIVAAGWGRRTQWLHNVEAGLTSEVWIGRSRFVPVVRRLEVDEAMAVLADYEAHSGLPKSVVRSVLSRLLGWRYDGSEAARRRAVEQLPLIGFRPPA